VAAEPRSERHDCVKQALAVLRGLDDGDYGLVAHESLHTVAYNLRDKHAKQRAKGWQGSGKPITQNCSNFISPSLP
jgi:hypothetical protein